MRTFSTLRTIDLPPGTLVPFRAAPGERVRILCGRVWLTEEGMPHDAFLGSGEEVQLAGRGLAVIEALGAARVQLCARASVLSLAARGAGVLAQAVVSVWRRRVWGFSRAARGSV